VPIPLPLPVLGSTTFANHPPTNSSSISNFALVPLSPSSSLALLHFKPVFVKTTTNKLIVVPVPVPLSFPRLVGAATSAPETACLLAAAAHLALCLPLAPGKMTRRRDGPRESEGERGKSAKIENCKIKEIGNQINLHIAFQRVDGHWSTWSPFDCQQCSCPGIVGSIGVVRAGFHLIILLLISSHPFA
jgi:hypothetical protein